MPYKTLVATEARTHSGTQAHSIFHTNLTNSSLHNATAFPRTQFQASVTQPASAEKVRKWEPNSKFYSHTKQELPRPSNIVSIHSLYSDGPIQTALGQPNRVRPNSELRSSQQQEVEPSHKPIKYAIIIHLQNNSEAR